MVKNKPMLVNFQDFVTNFTKKEFIKMDYSTLTHLFNKKYNVTLNEKQYRDIYMAFNVCVSISKRYKYNFKETL